MKIFFKQLLPPIVFNFLSKIFKSRDIKIEVDSSQDTDSSKQDLDIYWTDAMASQLEGWGRDHTWNEIECLLINCKGKVLDIACGTGVNIKDLSRFPFLEMHGFDISDLLLEKAIQKGIDPKRLRKMDATKTEYDDNEFDYSYSIGSLEHFTEEGIDSFLKEAGRYTSKISFHMIPVSDANNDTGWIKRGQSYFNNSIEWWMPKFQRYFREIYVLPSGWKDPGFSKGKWFVCVK